MKIYSDGFGLSRDIFRRIRIKKRFLRTDSDLEEIDVDRFGFSRDCFGPVRTKRRFPRIDLE